LEFGGHGGRYIGARAAKAQPVRLNPSPVLTGEEGPKPKAWE
jgi:hypothetical protein